MIKDSILFILFFYVLTLVQTSFAVYFNISGFVLNFVLIAAVLINLFQKQENYSGVLGAAFGGLFLDIFSGRFFGFWIVILFLISIFIKKVVKNYVGIPSLTRT